MTYEEEQRLKKIESQQQWLTKAGINKPHKSAREVKADMVSVKRASILHEHMFKTTIPFSADKELIERLKQKDQKTCVQKEAIPSGIGNTIFMVLLGVIFIAAAIVLGVYALMFGLIVLAMFIVNSILGK